MEKLNQGLVLSIQLAGLLAQHLPDSANSVMLNLLSGHLPHLKPDEMPESSDSAAATGLGLIVLAGLAALTIRIGASLLPGGQRRRDKEKSNRDEE